MSERTERVERIKAGIAKKLAEAKSHPKSNRPSRERFAPSVFKKDRK